MATGVGEVSIDEIGCASSIFLEGAEVDWIHTEIAA